MKSWYRKLFISFDASKRHCKQGSGYRLASGLRSLKRPPSPSMCIRGACCSARQGFFPINGMYQMTFTDFGNVSVMVVDSKNKTCAGSYIYEPNENGVITFVTPRPSYYKVAPLDASKPMYFNSFAIDFTCIEDAGYVVESKTESDGFLANNLTALLTALIYCLDCPFCSELADWETHLRRRTQRRKPRRIRRQNHRRFVQIPDSRVWEGLWKNKPRSVLFLL